MDTYAGLTRSAEISPCGMYRYWLRRAWRTGGDGRCVCFVMLNPSTADGNADDNTLRRCVGYAQAWGFSILSVRNLYALRSTDPDNLWRHPDPVGPKGDAELSAAASADLVVCAWGAGAAPDRVKAALRLLGNKPLHCLELTAGGHPRHPLYARKTLTPQPYFGG